jgi:xanthine dehydrogenase YagR molybdenum-binding subunit
MRWAGKETASHAAAAKAARDRAIDLALTGRNAPFAGAIRDDVLIGDGRLMRAGQNLQTTYAELLARNGLATLVGDGDYDPVEEANGPKAVFSFAAVFAEVRVDPDLGLVRLNRFGGAYDAGRIINPKTARSQAIGGIIWGVGQALLEQSETDPAWAASSTPSEPRGSGSSLPCWWRQRSPMPCITRPARECATCRS